MDSAHEWCLDLERTEKKNTINIDQNLISRQIVMDYKTTI